MSVEGTLQSLLLLKRRRNIITFSAKTLFENNLRQRSTKSSEISTWKQWKNKNNEVKIWAGNKQR